MADWHSIVLTLSSEVNEQALELLSEALFEAGSAGIEVRDQQRPVVLIAAFPPELPPEELPERARGAVEAVGLDDVAIQVRREEPVDWSTHWRKHFEPLAFGPLWIVPTWLEPPEGAQAVLRMDPGMAFGTGSHETTALCLERIAELSPITSLLDVGTGTGVLAMAALLLKARRVVGTDNDPEALVVAKENAELNQLGDRLELSERDPELLSERFSVVVANILAEPLIELAPKLAGALAPGGRLVLSGVLGNQAERVAEAYLRLGLVDRQITLRGEWARIDLRAP